MALNLERSDVLAIVGGVFLVLILAFLNHRTGIEQISLVGDVTATVAGLGAVYFIYKSQDTIGGDLGRYMLIIGVGIAYYSVTLIPHILSHETQFLTSLIGQTAAIAVYIAQHILVFWSFLLIAYGFYLFWRGGQ